MFVSLLEKIEVQRDEVTFPVSLSQLLGECKSTRGGPDPEFYHLQRRGISERTRETAAEGQDTVDSAPVPIRDREVPVDTTVPMAGPERLGLCFPRRQLVRSLSRCCFPSLPRSHACGTAS